MEKVCALLRQILFFYRCPEKSTCAVLHEGRDPREVVRELMTRKAKNEEE